MQKNVKGFEEKAGEAAEFLGLLTNKHRLLLLCLLLEGEMHVSELVEQVSISQSAISQHLALLKEQGVVSARRDRQRQYYSVADPTIGQILALLAGRFCPPD